MASERCKYMSAPGGPRCVRRAHRDGRCKAHGRRVLSIRTRPCPVCAPHDLNGCGLCRGVMTINVAEVSRG